MSIELTPTRIDQRIAEMRGSRANAAGSEMPSEYHHLMAQRREGLVSLPSIANRIAIMSRLGLRPIRGKASARLTGYW